MNSSRACRDYRCAVSGPISRSRSNIAFRSPLRHLRANHAPSSKNSNSGFSPRYPRSPRWPKPSTASSGSGREIYPRSPGTPDTVKAIAGIHGWTFSGATRIRRPTRAIAARSASSSACTSPIPPSAIGCSTSCAGHSPHVIRRGPQGRPCRKPSKTRGNSGSPPSIRSSRRWNPTDSLTALGPSVRPRVRRLAGPLQ